MRGSRVVLVGGKTRRPLLAVGGQTLLDVRPAETQKLQAKGRFEGGCERSVPVVEAVFGEADRRLCALRQIRRDAGCGGEYLVVVHANGDQSDSFCFSPG